MVVPFFDFILITSLDVNNYDIVWDMETNINKTLLNSVIYDGINSVIPYEFDEKIINKEKFKYLLNTKITHQLNDNNYIRIERVLRRLRGYNEM